MAADGGDGIVIQFPTQTPIEDDLYPQDLPAPMNKTEQFFSHLHHLAQIGLAIATNKNQDYAGNGDPFANFRASEVAGVGIERAMLVRMMDKISRISNLIQRPPAVVNESLVDTCIDLSNYSLILATYFKMHPEAADDRGGH